MQTLSVSSWYIQSTWDYMWDVVIVVLYSFKDTFSSLIAFVDVCAVLQATVQAHGRLRFSSFFLSNFNTDIEDLYGIIEVKILFSLMLNSSF